nr:MAG TPA: outer capsid protein sigma-1 attachment protein [Caudoviricetes sp.]
MTKVHQSQLCWTCSKATNPPGSDCSWSAKLIPVDGWKAELIRRELKNGYTYESYCITKCPLYEKG